MGFRKTQLQMVGEALARKNLKRLGPPLAPIAPEGIERDYQIALGKIVERIDDLLRQRLIPALPSLVNSQNFNRPEAVRADAPGDDLVGIMDGVQIALDESYSPQEIRALARQYGQQVQSFNKRVIALNIKRVIGIEPFFADSFLANELATFAAFNANLITSLKDETLTRVTSTVFTGFQQGLRAEEISEQVLKYVDPSVGNVRARANLIARDQVNKLNGQLTQLRQTELGVSRYRWRTMGDDRVRDTHRIKDGEIFSWDDPPSDTGHPGEDYQCRCYAEPVLEDVVPGIDEIE